MLNPYCLYSTGVEVGVELFLNENDSYIFYCYLFDQHFLDICVT